MTTTTTPTVTARTVADGLRAIADMFEAGDLDARTYPEQPQEISVGLDSEQAVRLLAANAGVPAEVLTGSNESVHTMARIFVAGAELRAYHIARVGGAA